MVTIGASSPVDSSFLLGPFEPAYLERHRSGELAEWVAAGLRELEDCCACRGNCRADRMADQTRVRHSGRQDLVPLRRT